MNHYNTRFSLGLTAQEKTDLVEYLEVAALNVRQVDCVLGNSKTRGAFLINAPTYPKTAAIPPLRVPDR